MTDELNLDDVASVEMQEEENVEEKAERQETAKTGNFTFLQQRVSSSESDKDGSNVHVVCRVRPLNPQETQRNDVTALQFPGDGAVWTENQGKGKSFSFHGTFEPGCSQQQVFDNCGMQNLLDMALDGYACTAFAFGQTGSGKTYTMTGPVTPENRKLAQEGSLRDVDSYGLIQFSFAYLMDAISRKQDTTVSVRASYLEIYNEQVQDLLNSSSYDMVQVRWSASMGFYVENLFAKEIDSLDDLMEVLEDGMKNRAVAEHRVNEHSSRSHSILTVYLDSELESDDMSVTKHGKVSFVDLAGSEKVKDSGSTGETLIEATNINRSLLTLGNCISALSDPKKRSGHIPFRDSKLTKLLADGLGGSGVTLMIACVTPSSYNLPETLNTLRYAKRAKKIKNKPIIRIDPREELILKLQREMKLLKHENRFLRNELEFPHREKPKFPLPNTADGVQKRISNGSGESEVVSVFGTENSVAMQPRDRRVSDNSLYEMLQEYMIENEALRNENQNLLSQHSLDEREQKFIVGENDKLARKLEDLSRLMMSSPFYGSTFFSRTTSGRSNQSYQSWGASLTPLSQNFYPYNPKAKGNIYPQFEPGSKPPNAPMVAWNSTPPIIRNPNGLPPIKKSPNPSKKNVFRNPLMPQESTGAPPSKWIKGTSYAKQLQKKFVQKQAPPPKSIKKKQTDVLLDFPMRDYHPSESKGLYNYHNSTSSVSSEYDESGHSSSLRNPANANHLPADLHVRFGKPGYYPVQATHHGGALPNDAYKPGEISHRGARMKELSATSLRKLNRKMREEMRALDDEINSYQKVMTQQKAGKVTAT